MDKNLYLLLIILLEFLGIQTLSINETEEENQTKIDDEIVIIHTNDVHCGYLDNIGYDGVQLYKRELQKKYKYILTIDTGDHIQGDAIGVLSKGLDIINIMNEIGYNVTILGNHEFDYGLEALQNCSNALDNGGYICTNFFFFFNKTSVFPPYKIVEIGGKKIGFIAVLTPTTLAKTYLSKFKDNGGYLLYTFLSDNDCKELYETVQNYIDYLRTYETVDYVILLSHIGNGGDSKYSTDELLKNINGIDVVLDGHTHKVYNETSKDKDGKDIKIIQGGTKLSHFGLIKINITSNETSITSNETSITSNETSTELISKVPKPEDDKNNSIEIERNDGKYWVDKNMTEYINNIINSHWKELNDPIGFAPFDLIINKDEDHHNQISRHEESTLCDLITDSIRYIGEGKITIMSAGSVRTDLKKGNVTYQKILDILPFSNSIIVKEVYGQDILDALEYGVRLLPEKSSRFPQVSGISFKVNLFVQSSVEVDENDMFVKVKGDRRVSNVKVGNKKLDKKKKYRMSLDSFIGDGGDGYSMFNKYEEIYDTAKTDNEALIEYIEKQLNKIISDEYKETQGRINIVLEEETSNLVLAIIILFIFLIIVFIIIIICVKVKKKFIIPVTSKDIENVDDSLVQDNN